MSSGSNGRLLFKSTRVSGIASSGNRSVEEQCRRAYVCAFASEGKDSPRQYLVASRNNADFSTGMALQSPPAFANLQSFRWSTNI